MISQRVRTTARDSGSETGGRRAWDDAGVISSRYSSAARDCVMVTVAPWDAGRSTTRVGTVPEGLRARLAGDDCSPFRRFTGMEV